MRFHRGPAALASSHPSSVAPADTACRCRFAAILRKICGESSPRPRFVSGSPASTNASKMPYIDPPLGECQADSRRVERFRPTPAATPGTSHALSQRNRPSPGKTPPAKFGTNSPGCGSLVNLDPSRGPGTQPSPAQTNFVQSRAWKSRSRVWLIGLLDLWSQIRLAPAKTGPRQDWSQTRLAQDKRGRPAHHVAGVASPCSRSPAGLSGGWSGGRVPLRKMRDCGKKWSARSPRTAYDVCQ